jgi:dTDP-4-amino-4,6-dideoxygalactose transaminase
VIEDAAQAHGASWEGRQAGAWGELGCFSFYPTKNLGALGDGGAVCCSDAGLAARLRQLRQYGWQPKYQVQIPGGMNSRLDEIQAAFLRVLLPALPELNAARQQVAAQYSAVLGALPGGALPPRPTEAVDVAHLFVLRHARRDALRAALLARGIQTDIHYPLPDHLQPGFIARLAALGEPPMAPAGALPASEAACAEVFSLPCHPSLDAGQVQRVCDALREVW